MLSIDELADLEEAMLPALKENITQILTRTNRSGELEQLLRLLGMEELLSPADKFDSYKDGKIVVIGGSELKEDILLSIVKQLGLDKKRFEFCLDYKAVQKYDFKKMQYAPQYRVILFGPTPHSGHGKGDSSSIISEIEKAEAYPRVERLVSGKELKITKTNFREKLQQLIQEEYI